MHIYHSTEKVRRNTNKKKLGFVRWVIQRTCLARENNQCLHLNKSDEVVQLPCQQENVNNPVKFITNEAVANFCHYP